MKKIVLISCVSKKKDYPTKAENIYESTLFKYSLEYAKSLKPDEIYILSAYHGLLELDKKIEPYDKTLNKMGVQEKREWSDRVLKQMISEGLDLKKDKFIILAGNNYRKYIVPHLNNYDIPMEGLRIGEQLSFLKKRVE